MKSLMLVVACAVGMALIVWAPVAKADIVTFKDGREIDGVIKKVSEGKVVVDLNGEERVFDILDISTMDFTTPHILAPNAKVPVEHFLKDVEAQEIVGNMRDLEKAAADIKFRLSQIEGYWGKKESVTTNEEAGWLAAKEEFRKPLARYQELLDDLYFHVLAKVDDYDALTKQARKIYVGVKGPFNVGSSLLPGYMEKLPLQKYVPANWWDTIYFSGYNMGYEDGVNSLKPKEPPSN